MVKIVAGVVELVDTLDLGSSAARRGGSSPFTRTTRGVRFIRALFTLRRYGYYTGKRRQA